MSKTNNWFIFRTKVVQKIAQIFGVKVHVYQSFSDIKTIDTDNVESPNDFKQTTSVPERQIGD
jgi:hypothetical protein